MVRLHLEQVQVGVADAGRQLLEVCLLSPPPLRWQVGPVDVEDADRGPLGIRDGVRDADRHPGAGPTPDGNQDAAYLGRDTGRVGADEEEIGRWIRDQVGDHAADAGTDGEAGPLQHQKVGPDLVDGLPDPLGEVVGNANLDAEPGRGPLADCGDPVEQAPVAARDRHSARDRLAVRYLDHAEQAARAGAAAEEGGADPEQVGGAPGGQDRDQDPVAVRGGQV